MSFVDGPRSIDTSKSNWGGGELGDETKHVEGLRRVKDPWEWRRIKE